jgi:hypothetical protein
VKLTVNQLDADGWVIDNRDLDRLFNAWCEGQWHASCEDLAGGGACLIMDALGDRLESVECSVMPNPFARLTCKWCRGCQRPQWVPQPVRPQQNHHQGRRPREAARV